MPRDDDSTPVVEVNSSRSLVEANLMLCENENERLRLELATVRTQLSEQDRLVSKLKLELRRMRDLLGRK